MEYKPIRSATALDYIGAFYVQGKTILDSQCTTVDVLAYRQKNTQTIVGAFFIWVREQRQRLDLLPKDKFTKALNYAHNREHALRVFLSDAEVPLDTNHVEGLYGWCLCVVKTGCLPGRKLALNRLVSRACR